MQSAISSPVPPSLTSRTMIFALSKPIFYKTATQGSRAGRCHTRFSWIHSLAVWGLTEKEARAQGRSIRVAKLSMANVARAIEVGETRGFMKAIVDAETNQILGCAILGMEGGEVMTVLQVAMMGKLPYTVIRDGIFAHPTLAESLNNLFMAMNGQGLHEKK